MQISFFNNYNRAKGVEGSDVFLVIFLKLCFRVLKEDEKETEKAQHTKHQKVSASVIFQTFSNYLVDALGFLSGSTHSPPTPSDICQQNTLSISNIATTPLIPLSLERITSRNVRNERTLEHVFTSQ
jgi:hypothetical protein